MSMLSKYQDSMSIRSPYQQNGDMKMSKHSQNGDMMMKTMRISNESGNASLNESMVSESGSKLSIKKIAKIENEVYEILKIIEMNSEILTPQQIVKTVRTFATNLEK